MTIAVDLGRKATKQTNKQISPEPFDEYLNEGGGGGSGIHYSLKKTCPLFISLKFWVIH